MPRIGVTRIDYTNFIILRDDQYRIQAAMCSNCRIVYSYITAERLDSHRL